MADAPCSWPFVWTCEEPPDPLVRDLVVAAISELLWALTGRQFGPCPVTLAVDVPEHPHFPCESVGSNDWPRAYLRYGVWYNCPLNPTDCCQLRLPGPVHTLTSVLVDDVDVTDRVFLSGDELRYRDGCWPRTPACAMPRVVVNYLRGHEVPALGRMAAAEIACASVANGCRLPANLTALTRQGVSAQWTAATDAATSTGFPTLDRFLRSLPAAVSPSSVYNPDAMPPRMTTLPQPVIEG